MQAELPRILRRRLDGLLDRPLDSAVDAEVQAALAEMQEALVSVRAALVHCIEVADADASQAAQRENVENGTTACLAILFPPTSPPPPPPPPLSSPVPSPSAELVQATPLLSPPMEGGSADESAGVLSFSATLRLSRSYSAIVSPPPPESSVPLFSPVPRDCLPPLSSLTPTPTPTPPDDWQSPTGTNRASSSWLYVTLSHSPLQHDSSLRQSQGCGAPRQRRRLCCSPLRAPWRRPLRKGRSTTRPARWTSRNSSRTTTR